MPQIYEMDADLLRKKKVGTTEDAEKAEEDGKESAPHRAVLRARDDASRLDDTRFKLKPIPRVFLNPFSASR